MTKVEITGEPAEPESFYTQQPHHEEQSQSPQPQEYYAPQVNDNGHDYVDDKEHEEKSNGSNNNSNNNNSATLNNAAYYRSGFASRLSALGARAASPINMLANRMGSEGFLPETMFKECEKAARVLRGFAEPSLSRTATQASDSSSSKGKGKAPARRSLIHIPASVLHRAVGLAIFTTGRVGIHVSGATGSGVLIARRADGTWSPPSGIQVHSVGAGFILGADIYDCVLVLNTQEALEAFTSNTRLSLGSSLGVTAGPYGVGGGFGVAAGGSSPATKGNVDADGNVSGASSGTPSRLMDRAVYSYIKSRGIYAGIKVDGTVVTSRQSANASFYGAPVTVPQILRGDVPPGLWQSSVQILMDAIRVAETSPFQGQPPMMPPRPQDHQQQQQQQQYSTYAQLYPQQYPQQPGQAYPQQWYAPAQAHSASWGVPGPVQPSPLQPSPTRQSTAQREVSPTVSPVTPATVTATSTPTSAMTAATPAARSKQQEAAEEAAASAGLPPPTYSMIGGPSSSSSSAAARDIVSPMTTGTAEEDEAPPAYVDENQVHPSDSKAELQ